jgi:hypothetical protein
MNDEQGNLGRQSSFVNHHQPTSHNVYYGKLHRGLHAAALGDGDPGCPARLLPIGPVTRTSATTSNKLIY